MEKSEFINYSKIEDKKDPSKALDKKESSLDFAGDTLSDLKSLNKYYQEKGLDIDAVSEIEKAIIDEQIEVNSEIMVAINEAAMEMFNIGFDAKDRKQFDSMVNLIEKKGLKLPSYDSVVKYINKKYPLIFRGIGDNEIINIRIKDSLITATFKFYWAETNVYIKFDENGKINDSISEPKYKSSIDKNILSDNIIGFEINKQEYSDNIISFNNLIVNIYRYNSLINNPDKKYENILGKIITPSFDEMTIYDIKTANKNLLEELPDLGKGLEQLKIIYENEVKIKNREEEKNNIEGKITQFIGEMQFVSDINKLNQKRILLKQEIFLFNIGGNDHVDIKKLDEAFHKRANEIKTINKLNSEPVIEKYKYENIVKEKQSEKEFNEDWDEFMFEEDWNEFLGEEAEKEKQEELDDKKREEEKKLKEKIVFKRTLKKGMIGDDVNALQEFLKREGYLKIDETTKYFGPLTKAALIKYQEEKVYGKGHEWADGIMTLKGGTMNKIIESVKN